MRCLQVPQGVKDIQLTAPQLVLLVRRHWAYQGIHGGLLRRRLLRLLLLLLRRRHGRGKHHLIIIIHHLHHGATVTRHRACLTLCSSGGVDAGALWAGPLCCAAATAHAPAAQAWLRPPTPPLPL